ncbi:hypothetical protein ACJ73_04924 [Blastomyces percursus]|uniref:Uncharacterized protein n=1 Tax=Blastomyces percursus TaxID=1658174 RepID=A0A1J9R6W7_9EURO|nr:hypothetical protein ACJ73_04924 [Blastomyces percursus]
MAIPTNPLRQPDDPHFPTAIKSVEPGSDTSLDTMITLTEGFHYLMRFHLASSGAVGQTVTASRLTAAANNARSIPELQSAITNDFFRYLQNTCEADLEPWGQSDGEVDDYVYCKLSSMLKMRGTVLLAASGSYDRCGSPQPVVFDSFKLVDGCSDWYIVMLHEEEPRRCHAVPLRSQDILYRWEKLGIDLWLKSKSSECCNFVPSKHPMWRAKGQRAMTQKQHGDLGSPMWRTSQGLAVSNEPSTDFYENLLR